MKKDRHILLSELLEDQRAAQSMLDALPNHDDYFGDTSDKADEENESGFITHPSVNYPYVAYKLALKDAVDPFLPKDGYVYSTAPKKVLVTCDNTVSPYKVSATFEDGTVFYEGEGYEGLVGLYEAQSEESRLRSESGNYYLYDKEILKHTTEEIFGPGVPPSEGQRATRVLHGTTSITMSLKHINAYISWARDYVEWVNNPDSFYNAWQIVKHHPAMWLNGKEEATIDTEREPWLWHEIGRTEDGETYHMFETGSAVPPERQHHYHDLDLDVYSSTYEEGIIELAWLINTKWHWNAAPRTTIELEESELQKTLRESVERYEQNPDEGKSYLL